MDENNHMDEEKNYYTVKEAADYLGMTRQGIHYAILNKNKHLCILDTNHPKPYWKIPKHLVENYFKDK